MTREAIEHDNSLYKMATADHFHGGYMNLSNDLTNHLTNQYDDRI